MIFGKDVLFVRMLPLFCLLLLLALVLCPLAALHAPSAGQPAAPAAAPAATAAVTHPLAAADRRERLIGTLAAAMPASAHPEALKALAVAAASLFAAHPDAAPAYWDPAKRKAVWGNGFERSEEKLAAAVDAVAGEQLTHAGAPVPASWHALSAGRTRSASAAWGDAADWLIGVESPGDRLSPAFEQTITVDAERFAAALRPLGAACTGAPADWITAQTADPDGYTATVTVCGKAFTGTQIYIALGLPSAAFEVNYTDGGFAFSVRGNGHGVGLSCYGADYMARQGSDYRTILAHYYPETLLQTQS